MFLLEQSFFSGERVPKKPFGQEARHTPNCLMPSLSRWMKSLGMHVRQPFEAEQVRQPPRHPGPPKFTSQKKELWVSFDADFIARMFTVFLVYCLSIKYRSLRVWYVFAFETAFKKLFYLLGLNIFHSCTLPDTYVMSICFMVLHIPRCVS